MAQAATSRLDVSRELEKDHVTPGDVAGLKPGTRFTIKAIDWGSVRAEGGQAKRKLLLWFHGCVKPVRCNKTTLRALAAAWGTDAALWLKRDVTLALASCPKTPLNPEAKCVFAMPADEKAGDDLSLPPDAARELEAGR